MAKLYKKNHIIFPLICLIFLFIFTKFVFAQTETPTPTPTPATSESQKKDDLQKQISELEGKISGLKSQANSLSSQIKIIDSQVALTELKIANAQAEIKNLKSDIEITKNKISSSEGDLEKTSKAFIGRAEAVYKQGSIDPWQVILTSNTLDNFFTRLKYLKIVQLFDKKNIYAAEQAKVNYSNQQEILEDKKREEEALNQKLQAYNDELSRDKDSKKKLLSETQGSEANYQKLLAQAKAQLASFSNFVTSQGGASLLSGQTSCDDWGCYYNQRDSQWGGSSLNGTQYTLASDGCLVTAMAMVYTHYGYRNVTPITINSNSQNFASYYPAYLLKRISAEGKTTERIWAEIDGVLSSGHPVVVGISYDAGNIADHFVVFVSGSGGNYTMNDPFTPGGHKISFRERYPSERIVEYEKVTFL